MSEMVFSEQRKAAVELNEKIIITAQMAQKNLYDMCVMLKRMRDDKLYKELGYANFDDYCENEIGFSRRNARNYIAIIEKVNLDGKSISRIGMTKLSLLASLSEGQQEEIQQAVNVEDVTVRELKAEIEKLKADNHEVKCSLLTANSEKRSLRHQLADANSRITELESHPVEVAVQYQDTPETLKKIDDLNQRIVETTSQKSKAVAQQTALAQQIADMQKNLEELRNANKLLEIRLQNAEPQTAVMDSTEIFKAYKRNLVNAVNMMMTFLLTHTDDKNMPFFKEQVDKEIQKINQFFNGGKN